MRKGTYHTQESRDKISASKTKEFVWYHKYVNGGVVEIQVMRGSAIPPGFRKGKDYTGKVRL